MSNRKERLKKSLGISEYPWSSDDDEIDEGQLIGTTLRNNGDGDPHVLGDIPMSCEPPSMSTSQRAKARRESQLFWTIVHNQHNSDLMRTSSRVVPELPMRTVGRPVIHVPSTEARPSTSGRISPTTDVQRILAFGGLNRSRPSSSSTNLLNLPRRIATTTSVFSTPTAVSVEADVPSRNLFLQQFTTAAGPVFGIATTTSVFSTPTAVSVEADVTSRNSFMQRFPTAPRPGFVNMPPLPSSSTASLGQPSNSDYVDAPEPISIDHSDDDAVIAVAADGDTVGATNNTSTMSLEEEIVEIDPEIDVVTAACVGVGEVEIAQDVSTEDAAISNDTTEPTQQQSQGVKRKNEDGGDYEMNSVKQFNQILLRLLECPVCLEWMEPPMSQCRRGHLVCSGCRARLEFCPVCRTGFSSVRNRAMEGVAELLRYPCRHGCGREVRFRRRATHEDNCAARRYRCVAPACQHRAPMPLHDLAHHFQSKHLSMLKIGRKHRFSLKLNSEHHDNWLIMISYCGTTELFHLRVDVDLRKWGVVVYVAYIGPKRNAKNFTYEVTVLGQHNARKLVYTRTTHCDLDRTGLNVTQHDCFHLTIDQALNFLRVKNRQYEPDKFLSFNLEIGKCESHAPKEDSDS